MYFVDIRVLALSTFIKINQKSIRLLREMTEYNLFWMNYLNVGIGTYCAIIVYLTYLLLFNDISVGFQRTFQLVYLTHAALLTITLHFNVNITRKHRNVVHQMTRLDDLINRFKLEHTVHRIKMDTLVESWRCHKFGMKLSNNFLFDSNAYLTVMGRL